MKELPLPRDCQINPMIDGTKQMNILEMRLFWLALDDVRTQLATRGGSCQGKSNGFLPMDHILSVSHPHVTS